MPWGPKDATRFTKKANTASKKRQFAHVADSVLERTGDEGQAIREANAAVAKNKSGNSQPIQRRMSTPAPAPDAHPHDPYAKRKY